MQMVYNSDAFTVVEFDLAGATVGGDREAGARAGGYEIVDKFARKEIFLEGAAAEGFKRAVQALAQTQPSEEDFDNLIAGYTALAQQPVVLH
jgi:hypothetical protein